MRSCEDSTQHSSLISLSVTCGASVALGIVTGPGALIVHTRMKADTSQLPVSDRSHVFGCSLSSCCTNTALRPGNQPPPQVIPRKCILCVLASAAEGPDLSPSPRRGAVVRLLVLRVQPSVPGWSQPQVSPGPGRPWVSDSGDVHRV